MALSFVPSPGFVDDCGSVAVTQDLIGPVNDSGCCNGFRGQARGLLGSLRPVYGLLGQFNPQNE
jgi:hypothetical protein